MTRPQIIRAGKYAYLEAVMFFVRELMRLVADTIDLQDPQAPSAQDHSRQPHRPSPSGKGVSPHQAETLRQVEEDVAEEQQQSPRVSWVVGDGVSADEHVAQDAHRPSLEDRRPSPTVNGSDRNQSPSDEATLVDGENDDGLDDDLMQNMSSSPSIDDGGSRAFSSRPTGLFRYLHSNVSGRARHLYSPVDSSSSPYVSAPRHLPLSFQHQEPPGQQLASSASFSHHRHRHQEGRWSRTEYVEEDKHDDDASSNGTLLETPVSLTPEPTDDAELFQRIDSPTMAEFDDLQDAHLADPHDAIYDIPIPPTSKPRSDNPEIFPSPSTPRSKVTGKRRPPPRPPTPLMDQMMKTILADDDDDLDVSHDAAKDLDLNDDDDDENDVSFSDDPRFIDSGWGGESLRETEDIDFEFVYALHSFTATVDGQANASKGETMVLLDDSNSYWWLVRVVKDSSIGRR